MNWSAPPHAPDLCARWRRGIAGKSENQQQQQRARAAPRKRSVGRDARRDRIGEGRVTTHLTRRPLKFAAGRAGSQRRAPPAAAYRDRNLSPHGENAMPCRGVGVGVGAGNGRVARAQNDASLGWFLLFPSSVVPFPASQRNRRIAEPDPRKGFIFDHLIID